MSTSQPTPGSAAPGGVTDATGASAPAAPAAPAAPVSIPDLEAEISARRERLAQTIDELTERMHPRTIIQRQTDAAKARFADVATTPEGDLRVERVAAAIAVVAVVGGWLLYRRVRRG